MGCTSTYMKCFPVQACSWKQKTALWSLRVQPTLFFIQNKRDAGSKIDQYLGLFNQTQVDQLNNGRYFQVKQFCNYVNHVLIYHTAEVVPALQTLKTTCETVNPAFVSCVCQARRLHINTNKLPGSQNIKSSAYR